MVSAAVALPLLAMAVLAGHAVTLRCRWTGQVMEIERCCPTLTESAPEAEPPTLRSQTCCTVDRTDVESSPSVLTTVPVEAGRALAAGPSPEILAPSVRDARVDVLTAPRPPPLATRLALKQSRLI
jgi:hypothetical protein